MPLIVTKSEYWPNLWSYKTLFMTGPLHILAFKFCIEKRTTKKSKNILLIILKRLTVNIVFNACLVTILKALTVAWTFKFLDIPQFTGL